jgi:hypothetical protein
MVKLNGHLRRGKQVSFLVRTFDGYCSRRTCDYDAADVNLVNERVSDLDDYKTVARAAIFYPTGQSTLDDAAKAVS